MSDPIPMIERLTLPPSDADARALAQLLVDTVASGAAVSFLATLTLAQAEEWWRQTLASAHAKAVFLVARDAEGIVGTVQLHPCWAPNQPHRAEVAKLMVHRRTRRGGLGSRLMKAVEDAAKELGFSLLTLDTKRGCPAEQLYRQLGWSYVGMIPAFAYDPDGVTFHDDIIFYKQLSPEAIPTDP